MTVALGRVGASVGLADLSDDFARDLERSGWDALWVGPSVAPDLVDVERMLAATESIPVVTAITTIWSATPAEIAVACHRVVDRFGDRFVLGLGTAHAGINAPLRAKPLQAMKETLDGLDAAGVPVEGRLLAALGPKMTELAGQRSHGAHPYLAPASTIPEGRQLLGSNALLAQSLLAVITDHDDDMLAVGRQAIAVYLTLDNYRRNFLRAGFTETDLDNGGAERLVRALVSSTATLREAVDQQLQAGADHVTVGVRLTPGQDLQNAYRRAAAALRLS